MKLMSENLEKTAGSRLRKLLEKLTNNKLLGVAVGMVFTMIVQSSSATTVMVVGLVNAGLMDLFQAVGVIMGANIGTTITGQLVALNLSDWAPAFLFVGIFLMFFMKKKRVSQLGAALVGFGVLFMGMAMMSSAMKPLREVAAFTQIMATFRYPVLGVLAGTALTCLIQSSSASLGILQAMAFEGLIGLESSVYIVLGFNIGTCITAILASIGAQKTAKRAALIHLLFIYHGHSDRIASSQAAAHRRLDTANLAQ
jgi:phosphate:Na+ symporter